MARIVGKIRGASIFGVNIVDLLTLFAGKVMSEAVFGYLGQKFTNNRVIGKAFFFLVGYLIFGSKRWYKLFGMGVLLDLVEDVTEPYIQSAISPLYNYI